MTMMSISLETEFRHCSADARNKFIIIAVQRKQTVRLNKK